MQRELAVLSSNFAFSFPVKMLELIKTLAVDEQHITPVTLGDRVEMAQRRYRALADEPGTRSVIGLSLRPTAEQLEAFQRAHVPVVLIDESVPGASTVATDNVAGGILAAKHLLATGRRRIAVVCGNRTAGGGYNAAQRVKGLQQVLQASGVALDEGMIVEVTNYSYTEGIEALNKLLDTGKRPDAIFCAAGDDCAMGLLRAASQRGLQVPGDLAVIGYDDMDIARSARPPLTTIRQPLREMAQAAWDLASNHADELLRAPQHKSFKPELVVRQSA
jgi:LacI family transcriptional regulator